MEPAPFETGRPDIDTQWSQLGIGHGLSELDVMKRQRYFENSRNPTGVSLAVSLASVPGMPPEGCSSHSRHHFVQEQRKIISGIRAQPWPMQMKLSAVRSYRVSIDKHTAELTTFDICRDFMDTVARKVRLKFRILMECLTLWRSIIKRIEGHYGTSVASFFIFMRWLCALNCALALLMLLFIVLPQVVLGHGLEVPDSVRENGTALSFIIDGKGYLMEYSVLFYGFYDSGQNEPYSLSPPNPHPYLALRYKLPLAYILVVTGLFVLYAITILVKMAMKYKMLQKASVGERFPFTWLVFNGWDYAIAETMAATHKMNDLKMSFKETLAEAETSEENKTNLLLLMLRGFANAMVFLSLAGTSYAIYLAVENTESSVHRSNFHQAFNQGVSGFKLFLATFQVQGVITARNLALPYIFTMAEWLERLHPRTALKMKLVRMFLLYLSSLYVLIIALFTLSTQCKRSPGGEAAEDSSGSCCWENIIGQELFKLNLTHMLADLATMALDICRWLLTHIPKLNKLKKWIGPTEFKLADNVLRLIYGQALILLGVVFCPLLPVIGLIKYIFIFYCRAWVVYFCNQPPHTVFRVSSTLNFYLGILFATMLLCFLPVGYALLQMVPSDSCGPFRGLNNMLQILLDEMESWPTPMQVAMDNMRTATVIIPVLVLLGLQIYYYAVMSHALKEVNKDLKLQLRMEHAETREKLKREGGGIPNRNMLQELHVEEDQYEHNSVNVNQQPHHLERTAHRHFQLQHALTSLQQAHSGHSIRRNPMMAEPDVPSPHSTPHPSHPHANGLQDEVTLNAPPTLSSSHTHH